MNETLVPWHRRGRVNVYYGVMFKSVSFGECIVSPATINSVTLAISFTSLSLVICICKLLITVVQ